MSLNYVMLGSNDVPRARVFYDALLPIIGGTLEAEFMPHAFCYLLRGGGRMWVATPYNQETATPGNGTMTGLLCTNRKKVDAAHAMALKQGGMDEGAPGERPQYGPDFYAAYTRDLDGNKLSFVHFEKW